MDKDIYTSSLKKFVDELNKSIVSLETDIVIALSRKGPRLLEFLNKNYGLRSFPIACEHALPFIFKRIKDNQHEYFRIFIVDDAIYFGSTIQNLYDEIQQYIHAYSLTNVRVEKIITVIKSKESKQLNVGNTQICTNEDIQSGYGHYFVKTLMSDLATLNKSLEIEYPVLDYDLYDSSTNDFFALLSKARPKSLGYETSRNGNKNQNVVLDPDRYSSFNKIRFYVDGDVLKLVFMHPYYINNSESALEALMTGQHNYYKDVWKEIGAYMIPMKEEFLYSSDLRRNWLRTKVILANYLLSFDEIVNLVRDVEIQNAGKNFRKESFRFDVINLRYLLGVDSLVDAVEKYLKKVFDDKVFLENIFATHEVLEKKDYVIERKSLPSEELDLLQNYNISMVGNSVDAKESLSAMFTNLTLLVEKWTRGTIFDNKYRLRFGYTYNTLSNFIRKYSRFALDEKFNIYIHQWMDERIDEGCIVPQYIIDSDSDTWVRVFRPGENEDLLLSHFGRFALHVWNEMNKVIGVDKIPEANYQAMLAVIFYEKGEMLRKEEPSWNVKIDAELKPCLDGRNIVDYLERMFILSRSENNIERSIRFSDKEFQENTTLSHEAVSEIDKLIDTLLPKGRIEAYPLVDFSRELNSRLADSFDLGRITSRAYELGSQLYTQILYHLYTSEGIPTLDEQDRYQMYNNFSKYIKPYLVTEEKAKEMKNNQAWVEVNKTLYQILAVYNTLLVFFAYREKDIYDKFRKDVNAFEKLGMSAVGSQVKMMIDKKQVDEDQCRKLLLKLRDFISNNLIKNKDE